MKRQLIPRGSGGKNHAMHCSWAVRVYSGRGEAGPRREHHVSIPPPRGLKEQKGTEPGAKEFVLLSLAL